MRKIIRIVIIIAITYAIFWVLYLLIPSNTAPFNKFMPCSHLNKLNCDIRNDCSWHGVPVPSFNNESCHSKNEKIIYSIPRLSPSLTPTLKTKAMVTITIKEALTTITPLPAQETEGETLPPSACKKEGESGNYFQNEKCCSNLIELTITEPFDQSHCFPVAPNGGFICGQCGNNVCGAGENRCNCSKDCKEK